MNVDLQAAQNYGEALFAAAKDNDAVDQLLQEARALRHAIRAVPGFQQYLEAPDIDETKKEELARRVLGDRFHRLLRNFVLMMLKRHRILLLPKALEHFRDVAEKDRGIYRGSVETAYTLSEDEKARLMASLEGYTGRTLTIEYKVNPQVLGGVVFRSGDLLIDNSLRTQIEHLASRLMAARVL